MRLPRFLLAFSLLAMAAVCAGQLGLSAGDKKDKKDDAKKDLKKDAPKKDAKKDAGKKDDKKDDKKEDKKVETPKKEPFKADPALKEFKGHTDAIHALVFAANGKELASASNDRTVKVWDVATGKEVTLKGSPREIKGVAFLGDKVISTTGAWDKKKSAFEGEIRIWDLKTGKVEKTLKGHDAAIESFALSKDGKFAATGSEDQTVIVWDLSAGKAVQTLKGHTGAVIALALSADGKKIATTSADLSVRLWDAGTGKESAMLVKADVKKADPKAVKKEDPKKGKKDKKDKKDMKKGPVVKDTTPIQRPFTSIAFSPDGKKIAAGNLEGEIKIWDESGKELQDLEGHEGVWAVAFSPDGSKLATGGWDQMIKIWDVGSGKELQTIKAHNHTVTALVFHPTEPRLASGGFDGLVKIWEIGAKK